MKSAKADVKCLWVYDTASNSFSVVINSCTARLPLLFKGCNFTLSNSLIIKHFFMQRYNIFHQIHKGLRALLYETALQVQHTDFWNIEEAEPTIEKINGVVRLFEKHADSEDGFVFPAVEKYDPAVADAFEQEHVQDHFLGKLLHDSVTGYQQAPVITTKAESGKQIQLAFSKFMLFNLEHMAKEEEVLNKILWRHYDDGELMGITQQIIAHVPQEYMAEYSKWMMRGLNNAEITGWLKEVEKNAPEFVFQSLFVTAEKELPERRFRQVLEGLTEGAMLA
jgi:hemerythrin superfamily protein